MQFELAISSSPDFDCAVFEFTAVERTMRPARRD